MTVVGAAGQRLAWTLDDVRAALARYGRVPARLRVQELPGQAHLTLRVDADEETLVLRRYSENTATEDVAWELALIGWLVARGFPTPPWLVPSPDPAMASPVAAVDATGLAGMSVPFAGRPAAVFRFVAARAPDPTSLRAGAALARTVAWLHHRTKALRLPYPRMKPSVDRLQRLDRFLALDLSACRDPDLPAFIADVHRFRHDYAARLAGHALPIGVVHNDLHAGNVLVGEQEEVVALLDFDDASQAPMVMDVASLVWHWAASWHDPHLLPHRAAALVAAYQERRRLSRTEREVLPDVLALHLLARATKDLRQGLLSAPQAYALAGCQALARFRELTAALSWRDDLRTSVLGS